jgi:protein-disulfide isomerase
MYIDFQCPACKSLQASAAPMLEKLVSSDTITLVYHPVSTLDTKTKNQFSTRAAASAGCASDYGYFFPYVQVLLANQPPESTAAGLTDDQIVHLGGQAGMIDPHFAQCVRAEKYRAWAGHVNQQAAANHVTAVPTVLVNGKSVAAVGGFPTLTEMQRAIGH